MPGNKAGSDDQDVAGSEAEVLICGNFLELIGCDCCAGIDSGWLFASLSAPSGVVEKDATTDNASILHPIYTTIVISLNLEETRLGGDIL